MKKTICDLLINKFENHPMVNSIGWIESKTIKFLSFKSYKENIESLALSLLNLGLTSQDKVCLISDTRYEWHLADMAIMCGGGVSVPVYPSYTEDEILYIINHCEAEILLIENEEQAKKIEKIASKLNFVKKIVTLDPLNSETAKTLSSLFKLFDYQQILYSGQEERQIHQDLFVNHITSINESHIATIVYTSGTTGKPKGAIITHKALFQVLMNLQKYARDAIGENDRFLTYLPLSHVLGRLESFLTILFGCETVYAESMNKLINNISVVKPTLLVAVPRVLEKIYEKATNTLNQSTVNELSFKWSMEIANNFHEAIEQDKTPSTGTIIQYGIAKKLIFSKIYQMFGGRIRYFISGGAPLNIDVIKFLRNSGLTVLEGYGLTETIAPCVINPLNRQIPGTVGQPIGDVRIKFSEDNEILIKTQALFSGYYKNEEETLRVFDEEGWFKTGDIGKFDSEGFLIITDRKKDLIITSGGKNIAPQKLENMLKLSNYISNALIIGDKKKYVATLIFINKEAFSDRFEEFELEEDCDYIELASHPKIIETIQAEVDGINEKLASFETIKKFRIVPEDIEDTNYLTPSLKLKRKILFDKYYTLINAMY